MLNRIVLDDAGGSGAFLARLKLVGELAKIKSSLNDGIAALERLKLVSRAHRIRIELGAAETPVEAAPEIPGQDSAPHPQNALRRQTAHFYGFDPERKRAQRKKDNAAAMQLLQRIDSGDLDAGALSEEDKRTLAKYSGTGGALTGADGKKGSAYEYYTPKPIAEGIWGLMGELGFQGGKVLDPCAGTGIFGATAPESAAVDAVELNETSGRINGLVNDGPGHTSLVAPFEKIAANTPDEEYDAVVTNVPFGGVADRGGNQLLDERYRQEPLQNYFILRSLEKLKPGGLAVFITPPRCVSGKGGKEEELRIKASYLAEFLGAYRLPNSVFGTADADTMTDVMAFRKYRQEASEKIAELREQAPQTLIDAHVQWTPFIEGNYFKGEGRRFVLGEFIPRDPEKFRDVDRVITKTPVGELGRLLKKFPASRVDWDLLGTVETTPIIYQEGDTLAQAGRILQMREGRWEMLADNRENDDMAALLGTLTTPYRAFEHKVTWPQASRCVEYLQKSARALDLPDWLRGAAMALSRLQDEGDRTAYWNAGIVGLSVVDILHERLSEETGVNYLEEYPSLSEAMQRAATTAAKRPAALGGSLREGLVAIGTHYKKKSGFSKVWRGDVEQSVPTMALNAESSFEGIRYQTKSPWVDLEKAKEIYGADFDPFELSDWCVSADGKSITRADDYFIGNYADFLRRIDADIAAATDERARAKLLRQKLDAEQRIDRVEVSKLNFNLFSPHVTFEEKAEFLRRFVHPSATVVFDEKTGEKRVDIDLSGSKLTDAEKLLKRFGDYLKNGTITLGGAKLSMSDADALRELRRRVNTANEQFSGWVRGNRSIVARLERTAADPERLRFRQIEDEAPLAIPGMNPALALHGYQNAFVRRQGREFGGINGFGVGLGKTFTALASVQYAQSIGVKNKTLFAVPNSTLSNWHKEVNRAYADTADCLFVGMRINSHDEPIVSSLNFDTDLNAVLENRHRKIYLTLEAFERIRLRDKTIDDFEGFMRRADASFAEKLDKKEDERAKGKVAGLRVMLGEKKSAAPYLEDMRVDSLVFDEAHVFKNSAETVNFGSAKFLSLSPASKRGIDAQAKSWYVRGQSPLQDGVLSLTATPITNSPLEIYAMLALAAGHERVNNLFLGIRGADEFMQMVCVTENTDDESIDGIFRTIDVFTGLDNVGVLRRAIGEIAVIKDANDVGAQIVVPDRSEKASPVSLPSEIVDRLETYKNAFRWAVDDLMGKKDNRGSKSAYDQVSESFGESQKLIAHPFNLIHKMSLLIADPELDRRATFYSVGSLQKEKAQSAIERFNARKIIEERQRPGPMTEEAAIVGKKTIKDAAGEARELLKIEVRARFEGETRIVIDTIDPAAQSAFETIAEGLGLDLDVTVPPKLAAFLENYQNEQASPRGVNPDGTAAKIVKQLVFCDILPLHNKIKRLLHQRAGVPAGAVAVVTGKTNNTPDEIQAVQDGFNAMGEANKYRAIIANEKAEVGINLQIGTQAIHHLTTGWTPDSLEQRNGRGARQGNRTERINIYHYDADGTFDVSKRMMVDKKADWIGDVLDVDGSERIAVSGGLSREQMEALIDVVGDAEAMRRMQQNLAAKEAEARAASNRERQLINLDTIDKQRSFLTENAEPQRFVARKIVAFWNLDGQIDQLRMRIDNPKATATAIAKNEALLAELSAASSGLRRQIEESAKLFRKDWKQGKEVLNPVTLDEFLLAVRQGKVRRESEIVDRLLGRTYPAFSIEAVENGPFANEWQAEIDMARAMIEESKDRFCGQAASSGAYPAAVAEAIAGSEGKMIAGKPVVNGMFLKFDSGELGVVNAQKDEVFVCDGEKNGYQVRIVSVLEMTEAVYPGSAGYDACLTRAAEIEDAFNARGDIENRYSDWAPEVAQRRKGEILAAYRISEYSLPPPYFPYVVSPDEAATPVSRHILEAQKEVVRSFAWMSFVVPGSLAVVRRPRNDPAERCAALAEYARAHGLRLVVDDFNASITLLFSQIEKAISLDDLRAALVGDSETAIREAAVGYIKNTMTWIDFGDSDPIQWLPWEYKSAVKAASNKGAPETQGALPTQVVGIKGNTRNWKGIIKSCASMAGSNKYRWDGDALVWNVYRSTWDYLVQYYPQAARELELTDASRDTL